MSTGAPAITAEVAKRVLDVVDQGLSHGIGKPTPGNMCVEAAVCYALGLPHNDDPGCVSLALRNLKIRLNDSKWSSNAARAKGLRRLAVVQLGSKGALDDKEFAERVAEMTIRTVVPIALRAAAMRVPAHADALNAAAVRCEREGTRIAASAAYAAAATAAAYAAARADAYAAAAAAYAAADAAAYAAAYAAADAACAATAAEAACAATFADAVAAADATHDRVLSEFAEGVVQILVAMKAPGVAFLPLTEVA